MKKMSQMKEIIIAAVAAVALVSCQSQQEEKAIAEYERLDKEWMWNAKFVSVAHLSNQDSIYQYMDVLEYKMDSVTQYLPK